MPEYTKEQIDEAKLWLTTNDTGNSYSQKRRIGFEAIILSALDTAEQEREQATELAKQLAEKVARAEGRAKLLEARVAELAKAGNSAIVELRKNESEYSYERYLRAVKNWDALINEINKASGCDRCDGPGGAKTFANQVCMPIN